MAGNTPNIDDLIDWVQFYGERGLHGRKTGKDKIYLRCPFHDDRNASFWFRTSNGCFKCESCGSSGNALDFLVRTGECSDTGAAYKLLCGIAGIDGAAASSSTGGGSKPRYAPETLTDFAQTKHFDAAWLRGLGLCDGRCYNTECVEIPYKNESGAVTALRRRFGAGGKTRFTWQAGAVPGLFGLWLPLNRNAQTLVLVEGESDALSLWAHNVPALGVPGASTFQAAWAGALRGASRVLLHREPDSGGDAFIKKTSAALRAAGFADAVCEISVHDAWPDCKDPSDVHVQHGEQWASAWAAVLATARPVSVADTLTEGATVKPTIEFYTADKLPAMALQPTLQIVPGLLTEGFGVLGGRAKLGKSWLVAHLVLAVASGGRFLQRQVDGGAALLLDLEGSPNRLQNRFSQIWHGELPSALTICHKVNDATIANGGIGQIIQDWLGSVSCPRLVIIDTIGRCKGTGSRSLNAYENDTAIFGKLAALALENHIAVLGVHHLKKGAETDDLDNFSGSLGLTSVADNYWLLVRNRRGADSEQGSLKFGGRDIDTGELLLQWSHPGWRLLADDGEAFREQQSFEASPAVKAVRALVLDWPAGKTWAGTASEIAAACAKRGIACTASPREIGLDLRKYGEKLYSECNLIVKPKPFARGNGFVFERVAQDAF